MQIHKLFLAFSFLGAAAVFGQTCDDADACSEAACQVPDCACSLSEPDVDVADRPQIIYLSFVEGMTERNHDNYLSLLFEGQYSNPNGCPITATHYITAYNNDYTVVNYYYNKGHEIGSEGITHKSDYYYWLDLETEGWREEFGGMKTMLTEYAKVPSESITGTRVPFFVNGGESQFSMYEDEGFTYDNTQTSRSYGYIDLDNGAWPETLDYASELDCNVGFCPLCSYPGIWNQPFLLLEDSNFGENGNPNYGGSCDILDTCEIINGNSAEDMFDLLNRNFERAYYGNTRAPIGFSASPTYFDTEWRLQGLIQFIEYVTYNFDDVWFTTVQQGLEYRKDPVTNSQLVDGALDAFQCDQLPNQECSLVSCPYYEVVTDDFSADYLQMNICGEDVSDCPTYYPWLGDPLGETGDGLKK